MYGSSEDLRTEGGDFAQFLWDFLMAIGGQASEWSGG
jgi:hypothetical protein